LNKKFFFRVNVHSNDDPEIRELYLNEIFFGNSEFEGIESLYRKYRQMWLKKFEVSEDLDKKMTEEIFEYIR